MMPTKIINKMKLGDYLLISNVAIRPWGCFGNVLYCFFGVRMWVGIKSKLNRCRAQKEK
jgi:hypothetical protein